MIESSNNDYDLETIEVPEPFAIGDTGPGRAAFRDWWAHWRDAGTLLIAPDHAPNAWRPVRIRGLSSCEGRFRIFLLEGETA